MSGTQRANSTAATSEREGTPAKAGTKKFGTLNGVFVPTLLTILGVIMYLREGWVVGQSGLIGAWVIIGLAFLITGATALSMSSVSTNIRMRAGGAFSMISQSLGIEIGGAIGAPLYLSQTLAVSMYVFGFRAGWLWVFPSHPAIVVDLAVFGVLFVFAFLSAGFAFRIQYAILAVIVLSLGAVAWAAGAGSMQYDPQWLPERGGFLGGNFWVVFAVFFPAATGIMAGANMSGDLKDPGKSIPLGTLSAIAVSFVIYMLLGYWLATSATPEQLRDNYTIMVDKAAWAPLVIAGLLGATFSSALSSLVGAPRILQALAAHRVVPGSTLLEKKVKGEPRNALYLTAAIVIGALMLRDLNAVAPLITMFFLVTYAMINVVVFVEQRMGLVSFRPRLRVPWFIPPVGAVGCIAAMFIVSPPFGLIAVVIVIGLYWLLIRRHLRAPFGDVRSGVFISLAEWAAKKVTRLPEDRSRGWKPNLLVPFKAPAELHGEFRLLRDIASPRGSVKVIGTSESPAARDPAYARKIKWITAAFREEGVFASDAVIRCNAFTEGVVASVDALSGAFFRPNVMMLPLPSVPDENTDAELKTLAETAASADMGFIVFLEHPQAGLGREKSLNLWVAPPPDGWDWNGSVEGTDLAVLVALKLSDNWDAQLRLFSIVAQEDQKEPARHWLRKLAELARLRNTKVVVRVGEGIEDVTVPPADVNCFVLSQDNSDPDAAHMYDHRDRLGTSCLFVQSAGEANALA